MYLTGSTSGWLHWYVGIATEAIRSSDCGLTAGEDSGFVYPDCKRHCSNVKRRHLSTTVNTNMQTNISTSNDSDSAAKSSVFPAEQFRNPLSSRRRETTVKSCRLFEEPLKARTGRGSSWPRCPRNIIIPYPARPCEFVCLCALTFPVKRFW